ncbi:MAG TPA: protein-methionine-sulfoxide reductase catalytic subunit MsrP, partial [Kiloniellaceae bacterium]|nr:protein-methionine-sulfoxide reductase catalytic subunit MsrP [Kiloniellaceae bacterium]
MLIRNRRGWEIAESQATPENIFLDRRRLLRSAAAGSLLLGSGALLGACDEAPAEAAQGTEGDDPSARLYPVDRNERYTVDRPITDERLATTYNNFYEFGSSKNVWQKAQALPLRPWTVAIDGMVEQPMEIGIDDLLAKMPLEERVYRHRCVEAWSMVVPYSGFPLKALVDFARPLSSATYVKMTTFQDPEVAGGQRAGWYPWPYDEGLTMAEATHELAFIATGLYGKPIVKQNGAPLRLAVPWKYGFKHIKPIIKVKFVEKQPPNSCSTAMAIRCDA